MNKIKKLEQHIELLTELSENTMDASELMRYSLKLNELKREYEEKTGRDYVDRREANSEDGKEI